MDHVIDQCNQRIQLLQNADTTQFNNGQIELFKYYLNLEIFVKEFFREQGKYLKALDLLESGQTEEVAKLIMNFQPEAVLEQFAQTIAHGQVTKGE